MRIGAKVGTGEHRVEPPPRQEKSLSDLAAVAGTGTSRPLAWPRALPIAAVLPTARSPAARVAPGARVRRFSLQEGYP
jgi:hypothetical protein